MIKGTRRQIIMLHTGNHRYFDAAYFILREGAERERTQSDILREANRLLSEGTREDARDTRRERRRAFLWGTLCGSLFAALALGIPLLLSGWIF